MHQFRYHVVCRDCTFEKVPHHRNRKAYWVKHHGYNEPEHRVVADRIQ